MMQAHSFHIPVMGIGFTIDTPLKVSQYGIDSVIFISDDKLLEKIRKAFCEKFNLPYKEINDSSDDYRAKRITSYLNLINDLAKQKFEELKNTTTEKAGEIKKYFSMLPDGSSIKQEFKNLTSKYFNLSEASNWLKTNMSMGSIDVNIMTKLDRENYKKNELLPIEYNDAHAALRGFANSNLNSSVILSAGMNPRLYGYIDQFEDFFPTEKGEIKKKIVLKVSDYRSALIQGKFLAKKGLWVSEYRVESGLNCGGHAFATEGFLMGPILAEFRDNRDELSQSVNEILIHALESKGKTKPISNLPLKITAQGGVGTVDEHHFLLNHYKVDSVGWGTPFLLVPEATSVDDSTMDKLIDAKEEDLYLSNVSPLGVPFNNLKGNSKDLEKLSFIAKGRPGSSCPKKYLAINKDFTEKSICTASRQYQHLKLVELDKEELTEEEYRTKFNEITDKSCLCVGLGTSALMVNNAEHKAEGDAVLVCPGPNMAYFSKKMSLKEITDHIYGRTNVITRNDRPNMFVKELNLYIEYLRNKSAEIKFPTSEKQVKYFTTFAQNLKRGIDYYKEIFNEPNNNFTDTKQSILHDLKISENNLRLLNSEIAAITTQ